MKVLLQWYSQKFSFRILPLSYIFSLFLSAHYFSTAKKSTVLPPPQPKAMFPNQKLQTFPWLQCIPLVIVQNLSSHLNVFALKTFLGDISAKVLILNSNEKTYKLLTLFSRDMFIFNGNNVYLFNQSFASSYMFDLRSYLGDHFSCSFIYAFNYFNCGTVHKILPS